MPDCVLAEDSRPDQMRFQLELRTPHNDLHCDLDAGHVDNSRIRSVDPGADAGELFFNKRDSMSFQDRACLQFQIG